MDSSACFSRAVKHLFRHLHEPESLRKNALVQRFFNGQAVSNLERLREDRTTLDRLHQLIRDAAERCRDADIAEGKQERALRQYAIITRGCLEKRPMGEIAAALGISHGYCYEERADICRRIARYICALEMAPTFDRFPEVDEFRLLIDRVMRAARIDRHMALRECDRLVSTAPSPQQRIEALRVASLLWMQFGDIARAEEAYQSAEAVWRRHSFKGASRDIAKASLELMGSKLAHYHADGLRALELAKSAAARLERTRANLPSRLRQMHAESLYEIGAALCNGGSLEAGYAYIVDAEKRLIEAAPVPIRLQTRIALELWKLRNNLLMSGQSWYPSWQRLKGLTAVFEQAEAAGAVIEATDALVALAEFHAFAGNDWETVRAGRLAIAMAQQQPSRRIKAQTSLKIALKVLWTSYWRNAGSFLPATEDLGALDGYHRALSGYFEAEQAFKLQNFRKVFSLTKAREDGREHAGLTVSRHLMTAAAANELQRRREAVCLMEVTVPAAERYGSAPILRDAYSIAAQVTGDPALALRAGELHQLVRA